MVFLMKMEIEVALGNMLVFTFGQLYLYPPLSIIRIAIFCFLWFLLLDIFFLLFSFSMQVDGGIERTNHISDIVKQSLNAWTSRAGGKNIMNRFNRMKCLQEYMQYLQLKKEYDEKKIGVAKTLKKRSMTMFKKNYTNLTNMSRPQKRGQNGVGHHYTIY